MCLCVCDSVYIYVLVLAGYVVQFFTTSPQLHTVYSTVPCRAVRAVVCSDSCRLQILFATHHKSSEQRARFAFRVAHVPPILPYQRFDSRYPSDWSSGMESSSSPSMASAPGTGAGSGATAGMPDERLRAALYFEVSKLCEFQATYSDSDAFAELEDGKLELSENFSAAVTEAMHVICERMRVDLAAFAAHGKRKES